MKDLAGRTAVITGGGSGLGAAMARTFAAEGMRIVVADIAHDQAESVAKELRESGASALACPADVGDRGRALSVGVLPRATTGGRGP